MALSIHGRFFQQQGQPFFIKAVTYGPFPPQKALSPATEFPRIKAAGFNTIRVYETPAREVLDLAAENQLQILLTIPWHWDSLFTEHPDTIGDAKRDLSLFLTRHGQHPALGALIIANEIRPDLVRFMGPVAVREVLEDLIDHCRRQAPSLPIAYANFPTTEYLEPRNADFSAFNVYLEDPLKFRNYLRRLHNIAGDRPLLLTEFGYNTWSEGAAGLSSQELENKQSEMLTWAYHCARDEAATGFTVYSWCDLWFNGGSEVLDWSFGLTRRDGSAKPALQQLSKQFAEPNTPPSEHALFTVAICTRNGGHRLLDNLPFFEQIEDPHFELLIIDDGSTDDTDNIVSTFCQKTTLNAKLLSQTPAGLSAARNHAAREGQGKFIVYIDDDARPHSQWLHYLRRAFAENPKAAAAGGPNLPPTPISRQNAIVTACAGNASHILFTDTTAEHLPGCNFALCRQLLLDIGGFDKRFHAAGDDVDVCWRLLDSGHELAFHPAACVFHDRRPTLSGFLRQQRGYGEAEALLYHKHPDRFGSNGIRWEGFIYSGAPLSVDFNSVIYHGPMGEAPFQMLHLTHMPVRPLPANFDSKLNRFLVKATEWLARYQRRKTRKEHGGPITPWQAPSLSHQEKEKKTRIDFSLNESNPRARVLKQLQAQNWKAALDESKADLQRGPIRLLFAETIHSAENTTLHLRLLHPPIHLEEVIRELESVIKNS